MKHIRFTNNEVKGKKVYQWCCSYFYHLVLLLGATIEGEFFAEMSLVG
jgi:hypothetical protein